MTRGRRGGPISTIVVIGLLALSATGCGARWTDDQRAAVEARGAVDDGAGSSVLETGGTPGEEAVPTATAGDAGDGPTASGGNGLTGGTGGPSGGGAQTASGAGGALPCAAPSTEKGVTDDEITVAELSSLTGPAPGLGTSSAAAVRSYVAYRNATGGVCGRRIVLKEVDDGTDSGQYRTALRELAPKVLAITGGFAVGDVGGADILPGLGIPIVNSPTGRTGELAQVFDINPDFPRADMLIGKYKYLYAHGARKVAMAYLAIDQSRLEANIQRDLMEAAGLKIVNVNELPVATLSYDSAARQAANSGADYLWFISDTNGQASMAKAVQDTGFDWRFKEFSYTTYGTKFIELAGSAAEGATSWLRSLPTEEAGGNAAMRTYVEWMDRIAPGVPQDLFSIDSYVSVKAFFESLEQLPGPISRAAIIRQMATIRGYDAGGMFAPIDLGQDLSRGCFMGMIVRNGKWERLAPAGRGYLC